jgi:hypothetical protein
MNEYAEKMERNAKCRKHSKAKQVEYAEEGAGDYLAE